MISPEEWRTFCNDAVLLARFPKYNYVSGEPFDAHVELSCFRSGLPDTLELRWELTVDNGILAEGTSEVNVPAGTNYINICDLEITLPVVDRMSTIVLSLSILGTDIRKSYDLWIYPEKSGNMLEGIHVFDKLSSDALALLEQGERAADAETGNSPKCCRRLLLHRFLVLPNVPLNLREHEPASSCGYHGAVN